jgi:cytidine deaminase
MKKEKLNKKDKELIQIGKEAAIKGFRNDNLSCNLAGAISTKSGKIYTGINMHVHSSGATSICGERSAIMHLITQGERDIKTVVAVWISRKYKKNKEWGIMPPCGICRHVMNEFGNPWIIISKTKKVKLKELYPMSDMF